jgi:YD repeat-containing protein
MKKLTLLFGASLLALTFYSFSDKNTDLSSVLVKTITSIDSGTNTSIVLTYNGNKIVTAGTNTFTYTGDLITKVTSSEGRDKDLVEYTYDDKGRLLAETVKSNRGRGTVLKLADTYKYIYNADGTITVQAQNYPDGVTAKADESIKFTVANGNLVREEHFDNKGVSTDLAIYEYDTKNTIYKNVTGAEKLIVAQNFGENNVNNIIKTTRSSRSGQSTSSSVTTNVYTYNTQGYPQTMVSTEVATSGTEAPTTTISNTVYGY